MGSAKPFRPIAPRRIPEPPVPAAAPEEGKIKRASTACGECKRRRTKCSADTTGTPCAECALHGRECVIDEFADKRRKVAAKRTLEDLRFYRGFLELLLEAIRIGDDAFVERLVNVIRAGASYDEIQALLAKFAPSDEMNMPDGVDFGVTDSNNNSPPTSSKPDGMTR
ncbi:Zn(II)2Cys6 transcription factor domain-containing protein [Aspergillus ibericus CBS 121593]|uniref:Zn(2)-C6 fungal-type domain-containing protein n=1 Tax=Aspergillus ibericus CBS 121593 TaxID=1448316 RepID=A0A395H0I3_9EURO|nr:hypothetical protein BO80DRAFT_66223 [Aspergillus ibericus CBS 121593]RAL01342.1 hypothetical protein BO80DRAFT_66223 [Aspergillus ibericus CBS 121593]